MISDLQFLKILKIHVMTSALRLASVTSSRSIVLELRIDFVYAIALSPSDIVLIVMK